MSSAFQQMSNPKNFPMRPLNKGVVLNAPSQYLDKSMCLDAKNYIITEAGPERRPGFEPYGGTEASYDTIVQSPYQLIDMFTFWTSEVGALEKELLLLSAGPMYKVGLGGLDEVPWTYSTGTVAVSGGVVTGSGTDFISADIYPGDLFRCAGGEGRVSEVVSALVLELEDDSTVPDVAAGASYYVQRSFNTDPKYLVDWVVFDNMVILTDYNAPPVMYLYEEAAGNQLQFYITNDYYKIDSGNGPEDFIARCVAVFKDRVFFGNTIEVTDGIRRQRIRWSSATNPMDFSDSTAWIDLPYTQGAIVRIVPLNNLLVVYLTDAVYIGTSTNNPNLPVVFQRVETGSVGLVGMKAITSYLDGHFFVGQDDVYVMTGQGPDRIGTTVVKRTIEESEVLERIYASVDLKNSRIVFGFTKSSQKMEEMWSFQYKSKAWSYDLVDTYMIVNPLYELSLTWAELAGFTWDAANAIGDTFLSWDSMQIDESGVKLFIESAGGLRQLSDAGRQDRLLDSSGVITLPIEAVYETGDFDFNEPDRIKTFLRMSMKIDYTVDPGRTINFAVQGSSNRGRSWQTLGTLKVRANDDEGYVNFLMTSSHVRFRITTTEVIAPFTISEIVLKARGRAVELTMGTQGP